MAKLAHAIPLAVAATLVTLGCSWFLLVHGTSTHFQVTSSDQLTEVLVSPPPSAAVFPAIAKIARDVDAEVLRKEKVALVSNTPPPPAIVVSPPLSRSSLKSALPNFKEEDYKGFFLIARIQPPYGGGDSLHFRTLLKSLLGMAKLLHRTLVLPASLCNCRDSAKLEGCEGPVVAPFDCPLRVPLPVDQWLSTTLVQLRPARFLMGEIPDDLRCSHMRLLLPDGMDDGELAYAVRYYSTTRILEIEDAHKTYCGWDTRMPGNTKQQADFTAAANPLVTTRSDEAAPSLHHCTHYRGGTGEVIQFLNLGCTQKHIVNITSAVNRLPKSVQLLPKGSDLMVTFATGSVATLACNWVEAVRRVGVQDLLVGALDEGMMDICTQRGIPCVLIQGGEVTKALAQFKGNLRDNAALYPKMSVLKVGFYHELLTLGFNVWACDADAVFLNDPRQMVRTSPWDAADVAVATDCIDIPSDNRYPLTHCDYNTGLVYMRARPEMLDFTERWRETVANAKEKRIRDQAAFNMLTKMRPSKTYQQDGKPLHRILLATNGGGGLIKLALLPLSQYLNGHTYFVQHAHTLPGAQPPISVHMTYQFAEGRSFAYGKRQRLRQAGLWFVDEDSYYNGRYVMVSDEKATLPVQPMGPNIDTRDAVKYHLQEARHRTRILRSLLGIAKATGREVILPRMLCYCDFMWKEMKNCRVGGAETMRLPFDCPMDHVFDTPRFFEDNPIGVTVREASFLRNPRVPHNVSSSIARVSLNKGINDRQVIQALAAQQHAAIIEIDDAESVFCGFANAEQDAAFQKDSKQLLTYHRTFFCMMEGSNNAPLFSQCCTPRKPGDKFFPCMYGFDDPEPLPACTSS
mmetsp:Transcript_16999/g.28375  ORF Transcript_16999/g.28375 Transcript_16999/m.28375 type:complete len:856 (-) Transcript_16999:413-2980(-)